MYLYIIAVIYFLFLPGIFLKKSHLIILPFLSLILMIPLFFLLYPGPRIFTLAAIIIATVIPLAFVRRTAPPQRFLSLSSALIILAFYTAECSNFEYRNVISSGILVFSLLIILTDKYCWYLIIIGFFLVLMSEAFSIEKNLFPVSLDRHLIFVPALIYLTGIAFLGVIIPLASGLHPTKSSPALCFFTSIVPLFAVLQASLFFTSIAGNIPNFSRIGELLAIRFQILLLLLSILPLILFLRKPELRRHLSALISLESIFLLLLSSNTGSGVPYDLIQTFALFTLTVSMIPQCRAPSRLSTLVLLLTCAAAIFIPFQILFHIKRLTLLTSFQILLFIAIIHNAVSLITPRFLKKASLNAPLQSE